MMILHVSFPMEKLCSSPHDCGCSQGRLLLFCCIHAEAQKFASVNPVQKPFFVTVNSTNILYCCLYHFCTKNKRGKKKKGKKVNVFNVFLVPLQSWFPNWVTGLLIYCVSKLNWRTDAWLQCNKNKVPLLNSLTCFFIISIIIFIFLFHFPSPHVHSSSVTAHGSYTHSEPARGGVAAGVGPGAQTPVGFRRSWVLLQEFAFIH